MDAVTALTSMTASGGEEDCVPCSLNESLAAAAADIELPTLDQPPAEPAPADAQSQPAYWEGCLGMEGELTGDGRFIEPNALAWTLPMPLRYVRQDVGEHSGAVVVGRIMTLERRPGGLLWASGDFDMGSTDGAEAERMVREKFLNGVSMDLDDVSFEVRIAAELAAKTAQKPGAGADAAGDVMLPVNADGTVTVAKINAAEEIRATTAGRVRAATIVAVPAFASAQIYSTMTAPVLAPAGPADPMDEEDMPLAEPTDQPAPADITDQDVTLASLAGKPGSARALIQWYETGEGAARIGWGTPGDFTRCVQLANDHMSSEKAKGFCANRHHAVTGEWPGAGNQHESEDAEALAASGSSTYRFPIAPPSNWFSNPGLKDVTGLKVTAEGQVYGHLATWGTCHIGMSHQGCVTAPKSRSGYAYFRTGEIITAEGAEIPVGHITLDTTHATTSGLSAAGAQRHYEVTGHVVADVACGEDAFGIWVAGALRPNVSPAKVREMRAAPLSGDWRRVGGNLELVAALSVNVPGFPIPRPKGLVAGGVVQSLVAGGMVAPTEVVRPGLPGALSLDDLRYLKRLAERERREEANASLLASVGVQDAGADLARRVRATQLAARVHRSVK